MWKYVNIMPSGMRVASTKKTKDIVIDRVDNKPANVLVKENFFVSSIYLCLRYI